MLDGKLITPHSVALDRIITTDYQPEGGDDLATVQYVEALLAGLRPKASVQVATTAPYNLTEPISTVDGYRLQNGDRVLIRAQTEATENGVYVFESSTNRLTRATDFDDTPSNEVSIGTYVFVGQGNTYGGFGFFVSESNANGDIQVGTHTLIFSVHSQAVSYLPGQGISFNGNRIKVDGAALTGGGLIWNGEDEKFEVNASTLAGSGLQAENGEVVLGGVLSRYTTVQLAPEYSNGDQFHIMNANNEELLSITPYAIYAKASSFQVEASNDVVLGSADYSDMLRLSGTDFQVNAPNVLVTTENLKLDVSKGAEYTDDFSANFTARSLVDKGYVDALVGNAATALAGNGLVQQDNTLNLGGLFSENINLFTTNNKAFEVKVAGFYDEDAGNLVSSFKVNGYSSETLLVANDAEYFSCRYLTEGLIINKFPGTKLSKLSHDTLALSDHETGSNRRLYYSSKTPGQSILVYGFGNSTQNSQVGATFENLQWNSLVPKLWVEEYIDSVLSAPKADNRSQTPTPSTGTDGHDTDIALASAPKGFLLVSIDGVGRRVARSEAERASSEFYFASPSAIGTARAWTDIQAGDKLMFNPTVAGYDLDADDLIDIITL